MQEQGTRSARLVQAVKPTAVQCMTRAWCTMMREPACTVRAVHVLMLHSQLGAQAQGCSSSCIAVPASVEPAGSLRVAGAASTCCRQLNQMTGPHLSSPLQTASLS